jgi:hypothetical protein
MLFKYKTTGNEIESKKCQNIDKLRELAVLFFSIFCKLDFIIFLTVALP